MSLAGALTHHEGALRASLQAEYGLRLLHTPRGHTEPWRSPRELADLVEHLPGGSALGRAQGGAAALDITAQLVRELEHTERVIAWGQGGQQGKRPEPLPFPPSAAEERERRAADERAAEKWRRREARRQAHAADK